MHGGYMNNSNEQWKLNGDCNKCRRKLYCNKICKAAERNMHKLFYESLSKTSAGRIAMAITNELRYS